MDWLFGLLMDWLFGLLIGLLIHWLVFQLIDWLIDWLIGSGICQWVLLIWYFGWQQYLST
jgi:hypothetical protein